MSQETAGAPPNSAYNTDYATTDDFLNFGDFTSALHEILHSAETPLTVGIFGAWGSGKTSLMRMLRDQVAEGGLGRRRTVWFTAWKYDRQEALWRAFILSVLDALYPRQNGERIEVERLSEAQQKQVQMIDHLQESVYQPVEWKELGKLTVDWAQLVRGSQDVAVEVAELFLPVPGLLKNVLKAISGKADDEGIAAAIRREVHNHYRQQMVFMEQFESAFREAIKQILGEDGRLIVFVDDLDRCLPEKAVEVLEAIKLFLEVPGTVFVLGMDRSVIERGVEARYGALFREGKIEGGDLPISGDTYLQKIVQIPFQLPYLSVDDMESFIGDLEKKVVAARKLSPVTRSIFARGLYANPRQAKRALNIYRLLEAIAARRSSDIALPLLAKTVVIQSQYPDLYRSWRRYPTLVQLLEAEYTARPSSEEETIRGQMRTTGHGEAEEEEGAAGVERSGGLLDPYLRHRQNYARLEQMLRYPAPEEAGEGEQRARFAGLSRAALEAYLRLAGAVESGSEAGGLPQPPQELLSEMLSGEMARAYDAVQRLEPDGDGEDGRLRRSLGERLGAEIINESRPAAERASAGHALGILGDPRPGVGLKDGLPEIEWAPEVLQPGPFEMGGEEEWQGGRQFTCNLIAAPYRIARYPITVAQYEPFTEAGGYERQEYWTEAGWAWRQENDIMGPRTFSLVFQTPNHPQVGVSWYEALAYCNWLGKQLGRTIRLPTESEWERAARHTDGRIYPWGNEGEPAQHCNMEETGIDSTSAVGVFPQGAAVCGALDMAGNVLEWCSTKWQDDYQDYETRADDDLEGAAARTLRGGSFRSTGNYVRCASRNLRLDPDVRYGNVGFRVAVPQLLGSE